MEGFLSSDGSIPLKRDRLCADDIRVAFGIDPYLDKDENEVLFQDIANELNELFSYEFAWEWIKRPNNVLGDISPVEYAQLNPMGMHIILNLLESIGR